LYSQRKYLDGKRPLGEGSHNIIHSMADFSLLFSVMVCFGGRRLRFRRDKRTDEVGRGMMVEQTNERNGKGREGNTG
jgi:hypothetical protein